MQAILSFKTPDVIDYALEDSQGTEAEKKQIRAMAEKFVSFDERVSILIDTDSNSVEILTK